MKKLIWLGAVSVAVFAFVAVAKAQDVGFENIFQNVSVDLKVNGQDGPVTVERGSRIVVSWVSDSATRCRGNWSKNDIKTSGTVAGRISKSAVVKVACINGDGDRDDDLVVVNVSGGAVINQPTPIPPAPTPTITARPTAIATTTTAAASPITVNLKANGSEGPITVAAGTAVTLSYTTTGKILECKGDVSGYDTGSTSVTANATKTYAVSCLQDGGTGSASDSVTVNVTQPTTTTTTTTATATTTPTTETPTITVTGPLNSYSSPAPANITFTSSGVSSVKIEACVNKTDCTVLAPSVPVTSPSTSWPWQINGDEPFVGAFGSKPIYIRVMDLGSGVYDFADSYIYVTPPASSAAASDFAGAGASGGLWGFFRGLFGGK